MLKISEQVLPILVVPSSPHSLVFRPSIDLLVLFDSRGHKPPYERKVLRRVLSSHLAVIFLAGRYVSLVARRSSTSLPAES